MNREEILLYIAQLPQLPGCYVYSNADGEVIYVGKAKNLRKRVSSYFHKEHNEFKTRRLVAHIADIAYYIVNTEADALILENNLIKRYQPRYNVMLKDGREYLRIIQTAEPFPRFVVSRRSGERSKTFGPFTSQAVAYELLHLIGDVYHIRTCRLNLPNQIDPVKQRFRACLEYDIHRCDAPCIGLIDQEEYLRNVAKATRLLRGEVGEVIELEMQQMEFMVDKWAFEQAEVHRKRIEMLRSYRSRHVVAPHIEHDVEVFSYHRRGIDLFVNMIYLHRGVIQNIQNIRLKMEDGEDLLDLLATGITELRLRNEHSAQETILPEPVPWIENNSSSSTPVLITIPVQGDKQRLLELSMKNARQFAVDYYNRKRMNAGDNDRKYSVVAQIQRDLGLRQLPIRIECFDNSNTQGSLPVSACVVFKNAKPLKSAYRRFHVKTVEGPDDYRTMREVVYRRYHRVLEEGGELPNLVLIDGGKGQLRAAVETLQELGLADRIELRGLAERLEELFEPGDPEPLVLSRDSPSLKVLQHLRDEAHRFGLTFHQNLRSAQQIDSYLYSLPGVGEHTASKLMNRFKSVKRLLEASEEELQGTLGKVRGKKLYAELHPYSSGVPTTDDEILSKNS